MLPPATTPFPNPFTVLNAYSPEETPESFYIQFSVDITLNGVPNWTFDNGAKILAVSLNGTDSLYVTCDMNIQNRDMTTYAGDEAVTGPNNSTVEAGIWYIAGP